MRIETFNSMSMAGMYGRSEKSASALASDFQEYMKARKLNMPGNQKSRTDETKVDEADEIAAYQAGLSYGTYGTDRLKYDLWSMQRAYQLYQSYYTGEEAAIEFPLMGNYTNAYNSWMSYQAAKTFDGLDRLGMNAPSEVKEAWHKAEEETGINGMAINSKGKVTQLTELFAMSLEEVYNGGRGDVLGNTEASARTAVLKALGRLGTPKDSAERKEQAFYEAFLRYLS